MIEWLLESNSTQGIICSVFWSRQGPLTIPLHTGIVTVAVVVPFVPLFEVHGRYDRNVVNSSAATAFMILPLQNS
jgi:hypothetical protein